jgi:hypothetical protein
MKYLIFLIFIFFVGCGSLNFESAQNLNPSIYYKQDVCFTYETGEVKEDRIRGFLNRFRRGRYRRTKVVPETVTFCGVGVLPYMEKYKMTIRNAGKLNFFAITTCHEEDTTENPDKGIFKKNGKIYVEYTPTLERTKKQACPMYISAYNRKRRHGFGIAVFEHPDYKLKSNLFCNGYENEYDGVSVCQSREGLIQKIVFDEPVKLVKPINGAADRKGDCPVIGEDYQKEYTFKIPSRECWYGFIGKNSKQVHQLLTVGYEEIIIRE